MKIAGLMIALAVVAGCADDGAEDMQSTTRSPATAAGDAGLGCPSGTELKCEPRAKLPPACACATVR